jgi:uncharacterized membrane protein
VEEFFIRPIIDPSVQGYNAVNTVVYAIILLIVSFFIVFPLLHRRGIIFDLRFAFALFPYILLGVSLRAINSAGLLPFIRKTPNPLELGFWTFTPGVWFLVFTLTILGLIISRKVKGKDYHRLFDLFRVAFCSLPVLFCFINFTNWLAFIACLALISFLALALKFILKRFTKILEDKMNMLAVAGQLADSSATAIALTFFSFREQHPLSALILTINPALFIALKVAIVLALLYYVDKSFQNKNLANFAKLFLIILGFSTGLASIFKLGFT